MKLIRTSDLETSLVNWRRLPQIDPAEIAEEFRYAVGIYDDRGSNRSKSRDMVAVSVVAEALDDFLKALEGGKQ